ncbi:chromate transporter [Brassicibacter mesophilus]|jgi:chromate transporter|uniref:chromate transporter n=1 Tax=Brassicibacter mesophilus TaxID=745119 RepID=UPI003D247A39
MLIKLFISFFKIGAFSFGGGYAMLPFIQEEVIEVHHWLTASEFVDILAIAQMTPGPIALNSATFIGYRLGGIWGSLSATTAVVMPSFIIILTIAHFFNKFKESQNVQWAFKGIRPVVLGLIASAGISVAKGTIVDLRSTFIAVSLFYLLSFKKLHPIVAIVIAGVMGVILY